MRVCPGRPFLVVLALACNIFKARRWVNVATNGAIARAAARIGVHDSSENCTPRQRTSHKHRRHNCHATRRETPRHLHASDSCSLDSCKNEVNENGGETCVANMQPSPPFRTTSTRAMVVKRNPQHAAPRPTARSPLGAVVAKACHSAKQQTRDDRAALRRSMGPID